MSTPSQPKAQEKPVLRGYFNETNGIYYHDGGSPEFVCSAVVNAREFDHLTGKYDAVVARLRAVAEERVTLQAENERLREVASLLALATDEGDDAAQGTHYVDKDGRIRCKGSFLELIEKARALTRGAP